MVRNRVPAGPGVVNRVREIAGGYVELLEKVREFAEGAAKPQSLVCEGRIAQPRGGSGEVKAFRRSPHDRNTSSQVSFPRKRGFFPLFHRPATAARLSKRNRCSFFGGKSPFHSRAWFLLDRLPPELCVLSRGESIPADQVPRMVCVRGKVVRSCSRRYALAWGAAHSCSSGHPHRLDKPAAGPHHP